MKNSIYTIVVAGANGNLGQLVCEALIKRAEMAGKKVLIRGLVRKGSTHNLAALVAQNNSMATFDLEQVDYANADDLMRVCKGAYSVISTLQGLDDIIIGVQSRLLEAAIKNKVRRFIPSDFSADFTKLKEGTHRNFDIRRRFHNAAQEIIQKNNAYIELTSIFQGGFTELLGSGWVLFDYKKRQVGYFGSPDNLMEFTTWKNTAEYAAAVSLDDNACPRFLYIAGQQLTPVEAQKIAKKVTGADFALKSVMPVWMLGLVIKLMKIFKPGKKGEVMPLWVAMQYGYCGALGVMSPEKFDNNRYEGIQWTSVDEVVKKAYQENHNI
jgi:NmrA-like family